MISDTSYLTVWLGAYLPTYAQARLSLFADASSLYRSLEYTILYFEHMSFDAREEQGKIDANGGVSTGYSSLTDFANNKRYAFGFDVCVKQPSHTAPYLMGEMRKLSIYPVAPWATCSASPFDPPEPTHRVQQPCKLVGSLSCS